MLVICYLTTPRPVNIISACKTPALVMGVPLLFYSLTEVSVVSITRYSLVVTISVLYTTMYRTAQLGHSSNKVSDNLLAR